jgi:SAM-dependent methyltransferase
MHRYLLTLIASTTAFGSACDSTYADKPQQQAKPTRKPDVIFVPTPDAVVKQMLTMAKVGPNDVVYDLGCGDGRIPIAAVRDFGAKSAVCIDIDPQRIAEARANVQRAGVGNKVEVRHADMFLVDASPATVVTLYLLPELNVRLRPKLQKELPNGARIVSQSFDMGEWKPAAQATVENKTVYLWNVAKGSQPQARRSTK